MSGLTNPPGGLAADAGSTVGSDVGPDLVTPHLSTSLDADDREVGFVEVGEMIGEREVARLEQHERNHLAGHDRVLEGEHGDLVRVRLVRW